MRRVLWEGECTKCHLGTAAIPEWSVYSLDNWESGRCLTGGLHVVQRWVFSQEYFKNPQASERHWCWLSPQAENSIANMTQSSLKMDMFQFDAIRTFKIQHTDFIYIVIFTHIKIKVQVHSFKHQRHILFYFDLFLQLKHTSLSPTYFLIYNSKWSKSTVHFTSMNSLPKWHYLQMR